MGVSGRNREETRATGGGSDNVNNWLTNRRTNHPSNDGISGTAGSMDEEGQEGP